MATTETTPCALDLSPGELVRVRSAGEIFLTLDDKGTLDGLPFMPEMLAYCGRTFSVFKRADKTCGHSFTWMRRVHEAVHLTDIRCDGAAHGDCKAACLMYWKEAWLERAGQSPAEAPLELDPEEKAFVTGTLLPSTTTGSSSCDPVYRCQATELPRASTQLRVWHLKQYTRDVRNWGVLKVLRSLASEVFNRYQSFSRSILPRSLQIREGRHYPFLPEQRGGNHASTRLDLQRGDLVRVKSSEEIVRTLDDKNMNRGLSFDVEMLKYCGRTARVRGRVDRLINEQTGEMIHIKRDCIILDGFVCTSDYNLCCTRSVFPYWREAWLEKIS